MTKVVETMRAGKIDVNFERDPRHGNWSVAFSKGSIPETLRGQWDSLGTLKEKVKHYLATRPANKTVLEEK